MSRNVPIHHIGLHRLFLAWACAFSRELTRFLVTCNASSSCYQDHVYLVMISLQNQVVSDFASWRAYVYASKREYKTGTNSQQCLYTIYLVPTCMYTYRHETCPFLISCIRAHTDTVMIAQKKKVDFGSSMIHSLLACLIQQCKCPSFIVSRNIMT